MSSALAELVVKECKASEFGECDLVFSGLDSDVAGDVGEEVPFLFIFLFLVSLLSSISSGLEILFICFACGYFPHALC